MDNANLKEITPQHKDLVAKVRAALGGWRAFIVAIDGVDHSGKSTLGRFLSWQCDMPLIETDMLLDKEQGGLCYRKDDLQRLIVARLRDDHPVIIEGICILEILKSLGRQPDYLIRMDNEGHQGSRSFETKFADYEKEFIPRKRANFTFSWKDS